MHGTTRSRPVRPTTATGINAVVWLEPGRAIVVHGGDGPVPAAAEIPLPHLSAVTPPALAAVAQRIGPVDRVLVLGESDLRIALEREIVAIGHRPDTIRDGGAAGPLDPAALADRLATLR